jgi:hypothetical protein
LYPKWLLGYIGETYLQFGPYKVEFGKQVIGQILFAAPVGKFVNLDEFVEIDPIAQRMTEVLYALFALLQLEGYVRAYRSQED